MDAEQDWGQFEVDEEEHQSKINQSMRGVDHTFTLQNKQDGAHQTAFGHTERDKNI